MARHCITGPSLKCFPVVAAKPGHRYKAWQQLLYHSTTGFLGVHHCRKIVTQAREARHWRTARRAVSCSGLCTARQYILPHRRVSALWGMKDYWQNFSDLIAVRGRYVAERQRDFVTQERLRRGNTQKSMRLFAEWGVTSLSKSDRISSLKTTQD